MTTPQKPEILILGGSMRRPSYTFGLCKAIAERLIERGIATCSHDPREHDLPMADPDYHHNPQNHPHEEVRNLVAAADTATAIVLATPIYHNGPSGVLKNLLDHLTIKQFAYKAVGLVSHGGNRTTQAAEQMRIWSRGLLGHAIATQVCTAREDFGPPPADGGDPELRDAALLARVDRFVEELQIMEHVMRYARRALT